MKTPFLWAGSKDRYIDDLRPYIPRFKRYFEPFLGGGAIYFRLLAARGCFPAFCSDVNDDLIETYQVIRDEPEALIAGLPPEKSREVFDRLKNERQATKVDRAVAFLYLNRNRFFGLGGWMQADRYAREAVISRIRYFSPLMKHTVFSSSCWNLPPLKSGDFVFCDPPYPDTNNRACYRLDNDDVLTLNIHYLDHVSLSEADFIFITKRHPVIEGHADGLSNVIVETHSWEFRKPGEAVQDSEEIWIRREMNALISI